MAIQYAVPAGTILLCDYVGFRSPEMVKRRPVVVVSPRLPHRDGLCAVVPLSQTPPARKLDYQVLVEVQLPEPWGGGQRWAKADMLATVAFSRLDMFRTERDQYGRRNYLKIQVNAQQMLEVRRAVLHGLGFAALTGHL